MENCCGSDLAKVLQYYNLIDQTEMMDKFKIVCPFHQDVNASMLVDLQKGEYYCFGCGKRGNEKDLVKLFEQTDDLQTLVKLSQIVKSKGRSEIIIHKTEVKTPKEYLYEAKRYFYSLPKTDWTKQSEEKDYLISRGYGNANLLSKVDARINYNDSYAIIFPMLENGRFRGYVCRTMRKDVEANRKYLYNKGFCRRNTLMGNYTQKRWVVVVEGYMDWLKFMQHKIYNCVALLGWHITDDQKEKMLMYNDFVVCALDNTDTGKQGLQLLQKDFKVVPFQYPYTAKDPGDLDLYDFRRAWQKTEYEAEKKGFHIY